MVLQGFCRFQRALSGSERSRKVLIDSEVGFIQFRDLLTLGGFIGCFMLFLGAPCIS